MVGVVQTDADELTNTADTRTNPRRTRNQLEFFRVNPPQLLQRFWPQSRSRDIPVNTGEIAQPPLGVHARRPLFSNVSIAKQFHAVPFPQKPISSICPSPDPAHHRFIKTLATTVLHLEVSPNRPGS